MSDPLIDPAYLAYQYQDSEKLRIRAETHRLFTESDERFYEIEMEHIRPEPGLRVLDVGCGNARLAAVLRERGVAWVGLDRSAGMLQEGKFAEPTGLFVQGDAAALPFASESFDRVISISALFHVADWQRALREMRRLVRPGGRVVLSTNGAGAMKRIYDVHAQAARELGYQPTPFDRPSFNLDHLAEVQAVFPTVVRHVIESALVFPEAGPAVRFYATNRIDLVEDAPPDGSHRERLLPRVRAHIEAIIAREGCFRVPKGYGYFVADV